MTLCKSTFRHIYILSRCHIRKGLFFLCSRTIYTNFKFTSLIFGIEAEEVQAARMAVVWHVRAANYVQIIPVRGSFET